MKIALYYPWIYLTSGVERTILETIKNSKHTYTIFTNHYDKKATYPAFQGQKIVELKKISVRRNILSILMATITIVFQKINLKGFDLLLVHSEGLGDLILFRNSQIPAICYCHTPLRPVFDKQYKTLAKNKRSFFRKQIYRFLDFGFKITDKYLWQKYKYILFNSKESLRRAKEGGLISSGSKYRIVNPGVDWESIKPSWKFEKYFFVPGRIMWTKNIELAMEAFKIFNISQTNGFKLIIAGQIDKKSRQYFTKLRSLAKTDKNICFIKNPSDKKMDKLYAKCYAVLATSFNEDWGLTPIEGNAFGKPAICVNNGGFKESQTDGVTGFLVDNDPQQFAIKMSILAKNKALTLKLGKLARNHSQKYSINKFISRFDKALIATHYN